MFEYLKIFLIVRPHNVGAAVLSVAAGFTMAAGSFHWPGFLLTAVALSTAAGNVINDFYDQDVDRINKPSRPLPSGKVRPRTVKAVYWILLLILAAVLFFLPWIPRAWVVLWILLLHLYSWRWKRRYLIGNLLVSAVAASGFLLGAYQGGTLDAGWLPAAYTFWFVLGRELVKDCEDIPGDRICGARTLPIISGRNTALNIAAGIFVLLAVTFPLPYFADLYNRAYGLIILLSVVPILLVSLIFSLRRSKPGLVSFFLKTGMFFGILAFILGTRG
ncbi:MAG: geranylgeranylglycerol-phosphate geranylgeranyltransferase [Candidatus Krumholzibacteriota bacterium]|nr:geranylgeranylglycerol-phosphate geranylgeranyltransferase [Candidatus Krumholzibacteriota bacterium]